MKLADVIIFFNPAGWPFIGAFLLATLLLSFLGWPFFLLGALLTAWCFYFFRDPQRITPVRPGLIVSPADGKVVAIKELVPEALLGLGEEPRTRISIFLNVFDVHVNRMPADGVVRARFYRPGAFVNASLDKASEDNERMALVLQLTGDHPGENKTLGVVQIAGLIARRIVCLAQEGDSFKAGQRYGIIRFGSRADIYLPPGTQPLVAVGQYMLGGETVLADCASNEAARQGEMRE
jgi:phosphatidylserine decarboxylase